jgi:site-specific DNA-methyltransferase (adenine-specific)
MSEIICGDCNALLQKMDASSVDLICFSPPYDKIRDYKGFALDLSLLGKNLYRVSKDGTVCAVIINDGAIDGAKSLTTPRIIIDWCDNVGWRLFEQCVYHRQGRPGVWYNKRFRCDHEYILFFLKGKKPKYFDKEPLKIPAKSEGKKWVNLPCRMTDGTIEHGHTTIIQDAMKCRGTVWNYATSPSEGNKLKHEHPATFPDLLADDIIQCFSRENEIVLDPTCGSGTTCVMAAQRKRQYIGMDLSQEYCDLSKKRLEIEVNEAMLE